MENEKSSPKTNNTFPTLITVRVFLIFLFMWVSYATFKTGEVATIAILWDTILRDFQAYTYM